MSEYRELTDFVKQKLGQVSWGAFGKLSRKYTTTFLRHCVELIPEYKIQSMTAQQKIAYLAAICRNNAGPNDVKNIQKRIDFKPGSFK